MRACAFRIVRGERHEHADAPHPLGLLRARGERPCYAAPPRSVMNSRRRIAFPKLGTSRIWLSTQAIKAGICGQRYGAQMVSFALQKF